MRAVIERSAARRSFARTAARIGAAASRASRASYWSRPIASETALTAASGMSIAGLRAQFAVRGVAIPAAVDLAVQVDANSGAHAGVGQGIYAAVNGAYGAVDVDLPD